MKKLISKLILVASMAVLVVPFTAIAAAPTLMDITPTSGAAGSTVTITGTGFLSINTVTYRPVDEITRTISNVLSYDGVSAQFVIPTTVQVGTIKIALSNDQGGTTTKNFEVTSTQAGEKHPEGTNVLGSDGTVYRMMGDGRNAYTSAGAFTSFKFNTWATLVPINSFDSSLPVGAFIAPRNGSLILDNKTVYLITLGQRIGFATESAFKGMGYSYSNVYPGDTSFMTSLAPINSTDQAHPQGTLINENGTLYVIGNNSKVGMPSMTVLESWGYWVTDAVTANKYDIALPVSGVKTIRQANELAA